MVNKKANNKRLKDTTISKSPHKVSKKPQYTNIDYIANIHQLVQKTLNNRSNGTITKFLNPGSGLRNLGWCICSIEPFIILEIGKLKLEKKDPHNSTIFTDTRFKEISTYIEDLLLKTNITFIAIEQISFSNGRYKYAETMLLKCVGAIHLTIIKESIPLVEVSNNKAQKLLLEKTVHKSKTKIKDYIENNIINNNQVASNIKQRDITQDIYDAIFIAYATHKSVIMYDKENKCY